MWRHLIYISVLISFISVDALNIAAVKDCLETEISKTNFQKKTSSPFHLHYGDAVVELFHVLSKHDVKRIKLLAHCVRNDDPTYSEEFATSQLLGPDKHLGAGNTTHLTGLVPLLLSDIMNKIALAFSKVYKQIEWENYYDGQELGARSCRLVSVQGDGKTMSKAATKRHREKIEASKKNFVISPIDPDHEEDVYDEDADENIRKFLKKDLESKFTVMAVLTDRSKYAGGTVVVDRIGNKIDEDEDEYDIDNEDLDDEIVPETHRKHAKYDALTSQYGRYQPERGNVLFIRSDHLHGVQMIKKGFRDMLVCEFWPYQSASVPPPTLIKMRPSIVDAKPFAKKGQSELRLRKV